MTQTLANSAIILKGTRHGLLASVREDCDWNALVAEGANLRVQNPDIPEGTNLTLDFGWREVEAEQFDLFIDALQGAGLGCNGILSTSLATRTIAEERGYRAIIGRLGLAQHQGRRLRNGTPSPEPKVEAPVLPPTVVVAEEAETKIKEPAPSEASETEPEAEAPVEKAENSAPAKAQEVAPPSEKATEASVEVPDSVESSASSHGSQEGIHVPRFQDEEPTLYLRKTLRSGQKVVFAGNVVLLGDLNPGSQIEADGDIVVMGQIRGAVHAGCEGDDSAVVIAASIKATQLRIADRFWAGEKKQSYFKKSSSNGTMRARLDKEKVLVEALPVRNS